MLKVWYELERFVDGRWVLDAVFDEADIAVSEAERLIDAGRASGVRVIRDGEGDRPATIIYRRTPIDDAAAGGTRHRTVLQERALEGRRKRVARPLPEEKPSNRTGGARGRSAWPLRGIGTAALVCCAAVAIAWWVTTLRPAADSNENAYGAASFGSGPTIHWGGGGR